MQERVLGSLKSILGRFVDVRSDQERMAAIELADIELERLVYKYMTSEISLEDFNNKLDIHYENPDARFNLRQAAQKLGTP